MSALSWLDLRTAVFTAIAVPVATFLARLVVKYLREWGRYALEGVLYEATAVVKHPVAAALSLKRYARLQLASTERYLPVPSAQDVKLDVDTAFVPLTLEDATGKGSQEYSNATLLSGRVRVVGDPGSGKSSLMKKLLRDACREAVSQPRRARLPILLELRRLSLPAEVPADQLGDWLLDKLREWVAGHKVYSAAELFDIYARSTGVIVLLDGLDEVSSTDYPRVEAALDRLSRALSQAGPSNAIVITMRAQFHLQVKGAYETSYPVVLRVQPFTPTDIYTFLTRWPFVANVRSTAISRIYEELTSRPTLRDMCRNPLVLAMYVANHEASAAFVPPESRTEFYLRVTAELLIRRRLQQTGIVPGYTTLRDQRMRILGRLALAHLLDSSQPANSLQWGNVIDVVVEVMRCDGSDAATIFRELSRETGLVSEERSGETVRFIHLTFCEFFAAHEAVRGERDRWAELVSFQRANWSSGEAALRSRLLEVVPFAAALRLPRDAQATAVREATSSGDFRLTARVFLETKQYGHEDWHSFVRQWQEALLGIPNEEWTEDWLADLHLFNVVVRDGEAAMSHMHMRGIDVNAMFESLVRRKESGLERMLTAYAQQDAAAAFFFCQSSGLDLARELPDVIVKNCDQPPFFGLVFSRASEDSNGLWTAWLGEAALYSAVTAGWLREAASPTSWAEQVLEVPKSRRWFTGLFRRSTLAECVTLAEAVAKREKLPAPLLRRIEQLPHPAKAGRWWVASNLAALATMVTWVATDLGSLSIPYMASWAFLFLGYVGMMFCARAMRGYRLLVALVLQTSAAASQGKMAVGDPRPKSTSGGWFPRLALPFDPEGFFRLRPPLLAVVKPWLPRAVWLDGATYLRLRRNMLGFDALGRVGSRGGLGGAGFARLGE